MPPPAVVTTIGAVLSGSVNAGLAATPSRIYHNCRTWPKKALSGAWRRPQPAPFAQKIADLLGFLPANGVKIGFLAAFARAPRRSIAAGKQVIR
jgi:hypothetical protein